MKKIEIEIPDNIPERDLAVIRKYDKKGQLFEDFKAFVKYLADNSINCTFITKG